MRLSNLPSLVFSPHTLCILEHILCLGDRAACVRPIFWWANDAERTSLCLSSVPTACRWPVIEESLSRGSDLFWTCSVEFGELIAVFFWIFLFDFLFCINKMPGKNTFLIHLVVSAIRHFLHLCRNKFNWYQLAGYRQSHSIIWCLFCNKCRLIDKNR